MEYKKSPEYLTFTKCYSDLHQIRNAIKTVLNKSFSIGLITEEILRKCEETSPDDQASSLLMAILKKIEHKSDNFYKFLEILDGETGITDLGDELRAKLTVVEKEIAEHKLLRERTNYVKPSPISLPISSNFIAIERNMGKVRPMFEYEFDHLTEGVLSFHKEAGTARQIKSTTPPSSWTTRKYPEIRSKRSSTPPLKQGSNTELYSLNQSTGKITTSKEIAQSTTTDVKENPAPGVGGNHVSKQVPTLLSERKSSISSTEETKSERCLESMRSLSLSSTDSEIYYTPNTSLSDQEMIAEIKCGYSVQSTSTDQSPTSIVIAKQQPMNNVYTAECTKQSATQCIKQSATQCTRLSPTAQPTRRNCSFCNEYKRQLSEKDEDVKKLKKKLMNRDDAERAQHDQLKHDISQQKQENYYIKQRFFRYQGDIEFYVQNLQNDIAKLTEEKEEIKKNEAERSIRELEQKIQYGLNSLPCNFNIHIHNMPPQGQQASHSFHPGYGSRDAHSGEQQRNYEIHNPPREEVYTGNDGRAGARHEDPYNARGRQHKPASSTATYQHFDNTYTRDDERSHMYTATTSEMERNWEYGTESSPTTTITGKYLHAETGDDMIDGSSRPGSLNLHSYIQEERNASESTYSSPLGGTYPDSGCESLGTSSWSDSPMLPRLPHLKDQALISKFDNVGERETR